MVSLGKYLEENEDLRLHPTYVDDILARGKTEDVEVFNLCIIINSRISFEREDLACEISCQA
jgi:hypothetical protein